MSAKTAKAKVSASDPFCVTTGEVILSYPKLFKATRFDEANTKSKPQFTTAILIDKDDKETIKVLKAAEKAALNDGIKRNFFDADDIKRGKVKSLLRDGDAEKSPTKNPEFMGKYFCNLKADENHKPIIVDAAKRRITDESKVYAGVIASVVVRSYAWQYQNGMNKGVSFSLQAVQIVRDGEPLGSTNEGSEDLFDELEEPAEDDLSEGFDSLL